MKKKVGIIGHGALGQQIETFLIEEQGKEALDFFYFDDIEYEHENSKAFRFNDFEKNKFSDFIFYIGLGYHHLGLRKEICRQLLGKKVRLPSFIHRTAYISPTASIGFGVYIYPMSNIDQSVQIEDGVVLNNSTTISHNSIIGTSTFIGPGVTIAGNIKIGRQCFIGAGSVISNNVTLGDNVRIGIGSNITKDIADNLSAIGNPFKIISGKLNI